MLFANSEIGSRIKALPTHTAYCPDCGTVMIPKCGKITMWHWAHTHKPVNCNYQYESEWHLQWKYKVLNFNCDVEVRIEKNITDVLNHNSKRLIEFQNSSINTTNMIERCENYKKNGYKVDWVFNLQDKFENEQLLFTRHDDFVGFRQKWKKKQLSFLFDKTLHPHYGRVWFDIGMDSPLFLVKKLYSTGGGYGVFAERDSPISKISLVEYRVG